jgi:hypothetical protein
MQEITTKYDAAVERVAILENEVSTKASLSEEVQRLKDELRGKTPCCGKNRQTKMGAIVCFAFVLV